MGNGDSIRAWLLEGAERCEHCEQIYVYELEYRCVDCDAPLCPICAVTVRELRVARCPSCAAPAGA